MNKKSFLSILLALLLTNSNLLFAKTYIDTYDVPAGRQQMFSYDIFETNEINPDNEKSVGSFSQDQINTIIAGSQAWNTFINNNTTQTKTALILVRKINEENASAGGQLVESFYEDGNGNLIKEEYKRSAVSAFILGKTIKLNEEQQKYYNSTGKIFVGNMSLGLPFGFKAINNTFNFDNSAIALYQSDLDPLVNTVQHELGHALGICTGSGTYIEGSNIIYFSKPFFDDDEKIVQDKSDIMCIWDKYLRVYDTSLDKEVSASKGMMIVSNGNKATDFGINKDNVFDTYNNSPYYAGPKAMQILSQTSDAEIEGKTEDEIIDYCQDKIEKAGGLVNYSFIYTKEKETQKTRVNGLPIHPYDKVGESDLSHIELRNSYMSHQEYRNWTTFMEAELAALVDIGYDINIKNYFGKSFYLDNITSNVSENFSSNSDYAIGTHVYSDNNNITQTSQITTSGNGSCGARIEGVNNKYNLNNNITVSGNNSIGLGVTFGKNHNININSTANITTSGTNSVALSFDFGKNLMTEHSYTKGSYILFEDGKDLAFIDDIICNDINGALVDTCDIDGKITANGNSKTAIYISENAYVKNININNSSTITGDIVSRWNSVYGGKYAKVQTPNNETLYTNLNFNNYDKDFSNNINGIYERVVDEENVIFNTLKLNITGNMDFTNSKINVYSLSNTGLIGINNYTFLSTLNKENSVTGNGTIQLNNNTTLEFDDNVSKIDNTINLAGTNSELSTINNSLTNTTINKIKVGSTDSYLSFDLGDTFTLLNENDTANDAKINQIKLNEETVKEISDGKQYTLFTENSKLIDLTGSSNVYYNNNKFSLTQDNKNILVSLVGSGSLSDAIKDISTPNYIVAENEKQSKDGGNVTNNYFEISGNDLDFNEHKGLVINKDTNKNEETTIKTSVYGASDTNLTVSGKGSLLVDAYEKDITLGDEEEVAISLSGNSKATLNARNNSINVVGSIDGDSINDKLYLTGNSITLNEIDPISIITEATKVNLNNVSKDVDWYLNDGTLSVSKDTNFSSTNKNNLYFDGGHLNIANDQVSKIALNKMKVDAPSTITLDLDLYSNKIDTFAFENIDDATINNSLYLNINFVNPNTILTSEKIEIPFTSIEDKNKNLSKYAYIEESEFTTPIFNYYLSGEYNSYENLYNVLLEQFDSGTYKDFNKSIFVSQVATQAIYLSQTNSYDIALANIDILKSGNIDQTKQKGVWIKPFGTTENIGLSYGPNVENQQYGTYFGYDNDLLDIGKDCDLFLSGYAGYIGAKQTYDNQSVSQNGGQIGATGFLYKDDFFTGVTINVGASNSSADTQYGHENFTTLQTGIASKTGYNFNISEMFIFQPSFLASYSYINSSNYTNSANVDITSSYLGAVQLVPGLKFVANLPNSWQPYIATQFVWNLMDETQFKAEDIDLTKMSVKPYIQYGAGVQKKLGNSFTGYAQVMLRGIGRNGVDGNLGVKYSF